MTAPLPTLPEAVKAAATAASAYFQAGAINSVSISYDGTRVKWIAWTTSGTPATGVIEVGP